VASLCLCSCSRSPLWPGRWLQSGQSQGTDLAEEVLSGWLHLWHWTACQTLLWEENVSESHRDSLQVGTQSTCRHTEELDNEQAPPYSRSSITLTCAWAKKKKKKKKEKKKRLLASWYLRVVFNQFQCILLFPRN